MHNLSFILNQAEAAKSETKKGFFPSVGMFVRLRKEIPYEPSSEMFIGLPLYVTSVTGIGQDDGHNVEMNLVVDICR